MAKYTFKQFQAEYPDDAACLAKLMEIQYGGSATNCRGVAAKEIERQLDVTYKCAWRMCHELRKLMASAAYQGPLGEWRRGEHHTNSIEGHWSLRAVCGTHVHISPKHAWKYISEFSYRHNMRHSHLAMFNVLVHAFSLPRLADA